MFLKVSELGGKIERPSCEFRLPERTGAVPARGSRVERAKDTFSSGLVQDVRIDHRRAHVTVPEKLLNRPNIISPLQRDGRLVQMVAADDTAPRVLAARGCRGDVPPQALLRPQVLSSEVRMDSSAACVTA